MAIDNHVDVRTPLQKIGLLSSECLFHRGRAGSNELPRTADVLPSPHATPSVQQSAPDPLCPPTLTPPTPLPRRCTAEKQYDEAAVEGADEGSKGWLDKALTGGSSTLALAFLCNKALFPVRTPITLALTPAVAR